MSRFLAVKSKIIILRQRSKNKFNFLKEIAYEIV